MLWSRFSKDDIYGNTQSIPDLHDLSTKDGILMIKSATLDFKSQTDDLFTLSPNKLEAEIFISTIKDL